MIHLQPHPWAGKRVRVKPGLKHLDVQPYGGCPFVVRDYFDRLKKQSWQDCDGNPVCMIYAMHVQETGLPRDNEVLWCHTGNPGGFGLLIHVSEVQLTEDKS